MNQGSLWLLLLLYLVFICAAWFTFTRPSLNILEQTSNKLVFRLRPTFDSGFGVSIGAAGLISLLLLDYTPMMSGFLFFLSLLTMALSSVKTFTFDKERDRMTIKRQYWFGKKILNHSINEISDVEVEYSSGNAGSVYRVTLILSSGEKLPLTRSYTSGIEEKQYIANLVKGFLNLGRRKPQEQTATG